MQNLCISITASIKVATLHCIFQFKKWMANVLLSYAWQNDGGKCITEQAINFLIKKNLENIHNISP